MMTRWLLCETNTGREHRYSDAATAMAAVQDETAWRLALAGSDDEGWQGWRGTATLNTEQPDWVVLRDDT